MNIIADIADSILKNLWLFISMIFGLLFLLIVRMFKLSTGLPGINQCCKGLSPICKAFHIEEGHSTFMTTFYKFVLLMDNSKNARRVFFGVILLISMCGCAVYEEFFWSESGIASWYGPGFYGKKTANGEIFRADRYTAAHKSLPFGTKVKVVNHTNGKSVIVIINDRGPFIKDRIIDLSKIAAQKIGMITPGTAPVTISIVR